MEKVTINRHHSFTINILFSVSLVSELHGLVVRVKSLFYTYSNFREVFEGNVDPERLVRLFLDRSNFSSLASPVKEVLFTVVISLLPL